MEKKIGLEITCFNGMEWGPLLSIGWVGETLKHFSNSGIETDYVYSVTLGEEFDTYQVILRDVQTPDPRTYGMRIAIRIPSGSNIVGADGAVVSPGIILNVLKDIVVSQYLKFSFGRYEYRGMKVPDFDTDQFTSILQPYSLTAAWGKRAMTKGANPGYVEANDDAQAAALMLAVPFTSETMMCSEVFIGKFQRVALIQIPANAEPTVTVKVFRNTGAFESFDLKEAHTFSSDNFGYNPKLFEVASVTLSKNEILEESRLGKTELVQPGVVVHLLRREGCVTVKFDPQERIQTYPVILTGISSSKEKEIYSMLRYNHAGINEKGLIFKGESILKFESLSLSALRSTFTLEADCKYDIFNVSLNAGQVCIELKAKKEEKAREPKKNNPAAGNINASSQATPEKSALMCVLVPAGKAESGKADIIVEQHAQHSMSRVGFNGIDPVNRQDGYYEYHLNFPILPGGGIPKVIVGCPEEYSGTARIDTGDSEFDYIANLNNVKRTGWFTRLCDTVSFYPQAASWTVWRSLLIVIPAIILLLAVFAAGVYYSAQVKELLGIETENTNFQTIQQPVQETKIIEPIEKAETQLPDSAGTAASTDSLGANGVKEMSQRTDSI